MKKGWIALVAVALVALVFGAMYVSSRNEMVTKNEAVKSAWAQVDVVLQRRADLIPNLVETVKGYAAQEQTVFHDVTSAREALLGAQTPADKIAANGQLDGAIGRLLAIVENYPQLKSNENFSEAAGRTRRHGKPHRRRTQAVQRHAAGLQHVHRTFSEQHLRGLGRIPAQQRILRGLGSLARGPQGSIPAAEPVGKSSLSCQA